VTSAQTSPCDAVRAHPDAQLAVFPELFVSGYRVEDLDAVAFEAGDASLKPLAEAAERDSTSVIVGFVERAAGRHHNSVACFDSSGELEAVYRKTHLTAEAGPLDEELILAEVGLPGTTDDRLDYLAQRRGELPVDLGVRSAEAS
jgi:predicted amidohydrolase